VRTSRRARGCRARTRGQTVLNPAYKGNWFERQVVHGTGDFTRRWGEVNGQLRRSTVVLLVIYLYRRNKKGNACRPASSDGCARGGQNTRSLTLVCFALGDNLNNSRRIIMVLGEHLFLHD